MNILDWYCQISGIDPNDITIYEYKTSKWLGTFTTVSAEILKEKPIEVQRFYVSNGAVFVDIYVKA